MGRYKCVIATTVSFVEAENEAEADMMAREMLKVEITEER
jgi:hypothetical protein